MRAAALCLLLIACTPKPAPLDPPQDATEDQLQRYNWLANEAWRARVVAFATCDQLPKAEQRADCKDAADAEYLAALREAARP